jgi:hypothetical protein
MNDGYKEVYYYDYCYKCAHYNKDVIGERCDECLSEPVNLYTHKPVNFEEKDK